MSVRNPERSSAKRTQHDSKCRCPDCGDLHSRRQYGQEGKAACTRAAIRSYIETPDAVANEGRTCRPGKTTLALRKLLQREPGLTATEAGVRLGVSKERICQIAALFDLPIKLRSRPRRRYVWGSDGHL